MIASLPPGLLLITGALLVPTLRGRARAGYMLLLTLVGFLQLAGSSQGTFWFVPFFDFTLILMHVDRLSLAFGYIFYIASFLAVLYALHEDDTWQQVTALIYAGSAIGAVFAGDMLTLFLYWEVSAVASVFLIWARRTPTAYAAGMRYLLVQVGSGVLLLLGILLHYQHTDSLALGALNLHDPGAGLILFALGIKCAFPLLHTWLTDAYPEASVPGTVFLSIFTTKMAIYALMRFYAGLDMLMIIGVAMALFPLVYALIENDLRRVLAYVLVSQLGFMVAGVGLGTADALNGVTAHALASVIYQSLLFMTAGAVLWRTGTIQAARLGGLIKFMPWTGAFCFVGMASLSAFPLFSGFVSKPLVLNALMENGHTVIGYALKAAAAMSFFVVAARLVYFPFFGRGTGTRWQEAPFSMLLAMGLSAALCVGIGIYPQALYALLPFSVDYQAYQLGHVLTQVQQLLFIGLVFALLIRYRLYPLAQAGVYLDSDWLLRRAIPALWFNTGRYAKTGLQTLLRPLARGQARIRAALAQTDRQISLEAIVISLTLLLGLYLFIDLFS